MLVKQLGPIEYIIDERHDAEYLAIYCDCEDVNCDEFYSNHKHLFNVDPEFPNDGIHPTKFGWMIQEGYICDRQECKWSSYLHVHHGAKNDKGWEQ
jgi:hypothetical protein